MSNHHLNENLQRLFDSWNTRGRNLVGAEQALIFRIRSELASVLSDAGRSHLVSVTDYEMVWRQVPQIMVHTNAKNPKLRKIPREEVVFTFTIEHEKTPVRDKYIDPNTEHTEDEVQERLDRGDIGAWCTIIVTATWKSKSGPVHTGTGSLSCVVLDDQCTARGCIDDYRLEEVALEDLNRRIAALVSRCQQLLVELQPASPDVRKVTTEAQA